MARPPSTYRSLLPFTTVAVVSDTPYPDSLPAQSPYQKFASTLEKYDRNPNIGVHWGTCSPALLLHDEDAEDMPRVSVHRIGDGKLAQKVTDGFMMYTTAVLFMDTLVRLSGPAEVQQGVLQHPKQKYWIGNNKYMEPLGDVAKALSEHLGRSTLALAFQAPPPLQEGENSTVRLANEIASTHGSVRALSAIKNIAIVALSVAVMAQGYLQVPETVTSLGLDGNRPAVQNLKALLAKPRRLRIAFLLAIGISPMLVFIEGDLMKHVVCVEEVLFNIKRLGNEKPAELRELEDEVWGEILKVAEGDQSAYEAYRALQQRWTERRVAERIRSDSRFFYDRPGIVLYRPDCCLYEALPREPYPPKWPMPPLALRYVQDARAASPDEVVQSPPRYLDQIEGGPASLGTSSNPGPNATTSLPGASKGAKKKTARGSKKTGQKKTNQGGTRKRSRSSVSASEGEPPRAESPEIELLDYSQLKEKDALARETVNEDLIDRLQEFGRHGKTATPEAAFTIPLSLGDTTQARDSHAFPPPRYLPGFPQKYSDSQLRMMTVWDATGGDHSFRPFVHHREDYDALMYIYDTSVQQHIADGDGGVKKPAFLSDPTSALFNVLTHDAYQSFEDTQVQKAVSSGSIVVPGTPGPVVRFDKKGLEIVEDLHHPIDIQDLHIRAKRDFTVCLRRGTLDDLYESFIADWEYKKALNALDLPNPNAAVDAAPYASDVRAVRRTKGDLGCMASIPNGEVQFGLAATQGALSFWHIDPHGQGTYVRILAGKKVWAIAIPRDPKHGSSTRTWTDSKLDIRKLDLSNYRVELILLCPGDLLLLQPGVLHTVFTVEASICQGGHYLPVSCLRQIITGAVHTFFEGRLVTNQEKPSFWPRMNSLACFFFKCYVGAATLHEADTPHVPDISQPDELQNLILFACIIELQNAIKQESYQTTADPVIAAGVNHLGYNQTNVLELHDVTALSHKERLQVVYARGRVIALLKEVFARIQIRGPDGAEIDGWDTLYVPALAWFIAGLDDYYTRSSAVNERHTTDTTDDESESGGETEDETNETNRPPSEFFHRQLEWIMDGTTGLSTAVARLTSRGEGDGVDQFLYPFPVFHLTPRSRGHHTKQAPGPKDLFRNGLRGGDTLYFFAHAKFTGQDDPTEVPHKSEEAVTKKRKVTTTRR